MTDSISLNPAGSQNAGKSENRNLNAELTGYAVAATVGAGAGLASAVVGTGIIDLMDSLDSDNTEDVIVDNPEEPVDVTVDVHAEQIVSQPVAKPAQQYTPQPAQPAVEQNVQPPVSPIGPSEPVIAEEQIDINDIDEPDIINYDAVDTLYSPGGEVFNVALVHDNAGNELLLVDVDDDKVYDLITDTTLTPILEAPAGLTVADAEIAVTDPEQYMAYNPEEHTEEYGLDTLGEDLIC